MGNGKVIVWDHFDDPTVKILGEVDVPQRLVDLAVCVANNQRLLDKETSLIEELQGEGLKVPTATGMGAGETIEVELAD